MRQAAPPKRPIHRRTKSTTRRSRSPKPSTVRLMRKHHRIHRRRRMESRHAGRITQNTTQKGRPKNGRPLRTAQPHQTQNTNTPHITKQPPQPGTNPTKPTHLTQRHLMPGTIPPRPAVQQLPLNIPQKRTRTQPKQTRHTPLRTQLLTHQHQPVQSLLRRPYPTRRLQPNLKAGTLPILPNSTAHHQPNRQRRIHSLLPRTRLHKISTRHHTHNTRPRHIRQSPQITRPQNHLQMRIPARRPESTNLIINPAPVTTQSQPTRNHHIHLIRTPRHRLLNLTNTQPKRRHPRRKTRTHHSSTHTTPRQSIHNRPQHRVIHTHRPNTNLQTTRTHQLQNIPTHRHPSLRTQTTNTPLRIIPRKRRQIHTRHSTQQPPRLPNPLHRPPARKRTRTTLHSAPIHNTLLHPVPIKTHTRITTQQTSLHHTTPPQKTTLYQHPAQPKPHTAV